MTRHGNTGRFDLTARNAHIFKGFERETSKEISLPFQAIPRFLPLCIFLYVVRFGCNIF
jgi:hypothetical protein